MSRSDFHSALKSEIIAKEKSNNIEGTILKLQYSKNEISYSLHMNSNVFSFSGFQRADLLLLLGLEQGKCNLFPSSECCATWVDKDFPLREFVDEFENGYIYFKEAEKKLNPFGLLLLGNAPLYRSYGDGHTAMDSEEMDLISDDIFFYQLSWIKDTSRKGWVFHYYPKHPPFSNEIISALEYIHLNYFNECPFFDFEPCFWQYIPYQTGGRSIADSNAHQVNDSFKKLPNMFSKGIESLVKCNSVFAKYGFDILQFDKNNIETKKIEIIGIMSKTQPTEYEFDVAISFAGPQREIAEILAKKVKEYGFNPFYDDFYPEHLWGRDLIVFFDEIYSEKSKLCVIFVSDEYCQRMWTNHERQSAQARALKEKGNEYILPIKVDDSKLPGMPDTIGYLSLEHLSIDEIGDLLIKKLKSN